METQYYFKKGTLDEVVSNSKIDENLLLLPQNFHVNLFQNEVRSLIHIPSVFGIYQFDNDDKFIILNKNRTYGSGVHPFLIHIGYDLSIWKSPDLVKSSLISSIRTLQLSQFNEDKSRLSKWVDDIKDELLSEFDDSHFELNRIKISSYNQLPDFYKKDISELYNLHDSMPKSNNILESGKTEVTEWTEKSKDVLKRVSSNLNLFGLTSHEASTLERLGKFIESGGFYPNPHPLNPKNMKFL